ncbi:MAG: CDP-glycerol glycerophosphotransferase family protein [Methanobacteriaceae archaeon]
MPHIFNKLLHKSNTFNYYKSQNRSLKNKIKDIENKNSNNDIILEKIKLLENNQNFIKNDIEKLKIQNNLIQIREKSKNEKINIVFISYFLTIMWDSLIELLEKDSSFKTTLVLIPHEGGYGEKEGGIEDIQRQEYYKNYDYFKNKGFNIIKGYDEITKTFIDIEKELIPDVIFYASPHELIFPPAYRIDNLSSELLYCYVPYSMNTHQNPESIFNLKLHKRAWKIFCETPKHKELSMKYSDIGSSNVFLAGCPRMDSLVDGTYKKLPKIWKTSDKLKIIWAPHHTISSKFAADAFSTFLDNYEFFYEYAKNNSEIEWIFKPHLHLIHTINAYEKLYPDEKRITLKNFVEYYKKWEKLPNATIHTTGDYINMFINSDAMITDSISFTSEYLYFNKPGLLLKNKNREFNEFGKIVSKGWYEVFGKDFKGIDSFIKNVLIKKEDSLEKKRKEIYSNYLDTNGVTAGETIYNHLRKNLIG